MWWIVAIIVIIIIINQVSAYNKRKRYEERRKSYTNNKTQSEPRKPSNPLYSMDISELFDEYSVISDVPPLDSLVRRAYEKWEITSGRSSFQSLSDNDKKTILRIAINIWNKRKKDKTTTYKYIRKSNNNY